MFYNEQQPLSPPPPPRSEMFYFAQKAVLHPSAPLWNYAAKDLTESCKRALTLIFKICDMDNDGAMSDAGMHLQVLLFIVIKLSF